MIKLHIKDKGHTIILNDRTIRTPSIIDITTLNEKVVRTELQKQGVHCYAIEFGSNKTNSTKVAASSAKKKVIEETISINNEQIENRLIMIETLLQQLVNKPESKYEVYDQQPKKLIDKEVVQPEKEYLDFIPSIDTSIVIKGSDKISKKTTEEIDLDKRSKSLSKFIKK
jgi:hypothetical protein